MSIDEKLRDKVAMFLVERYGTDEDDDLTTSGWAKLDALELIDMVQRAATGEPLSCVTRLVPGDGRATCAYLRDKTKIVVCRDDRTSGPVWLEHKPQAKLSVQGRKR